MAVKHKRRRLRDLSLQWSFALYMSLFVFIALAASLALMLLFSNLQDVIDEKYSMMYRDQIGRQAFLTDPNGEVISNHEVWIYTENLRDKFTERDEFLYTLFGILAPVAVPVVSAFCVLAAGVLFYWRKLKKPLAELDAASARITAGDLHFAVKAENGNELGRLSRSFETMRAALHENNREMWRMMEDRRRLNAAFAHDLRTPLTVLRGYNDFLLKYVPQGKLSGEKLEETLATMGVYIERLSGYTETMASLQKLDALEISPGEIDFDELCNRLKESALVMAADGAKSITFERRGGGKVTADADAVSRVFENIVINALRYAAREVKVLCEVTDGKLVITVRDDGPGFTPEALRLAAEPYFRDEKDAAANHFGIGLYICKLLCEKHGRELTVANGEEGGGKVTAGF